MNSTPDKVKIRKPPVLLKGLFLIILVIISSILFFAWMMINVQIEKLVVSRTSEYAHSITKIAADSSAEATFNKDSLQLKILVDNVAKDPHLKNAVIFAEDGQVIVQSENIDVDSNLTFNLSSNSSTQFTPTTESSILQVNDLPFIEEINYLGKSIGWFKVTIQRDKLEETFRQSINHTKNIILLISTLLLIFLFVVIFRFNQRVQKLISINHKIIQINAPNMPKSNDEWMSSIYHLSLSHLNQNLDKNQLSSVKSPWIESKISNTTTFCFCEFVMLKQEDEKTAFCLNQAELFLQTALQHHGIISQGNILSGCLIPSFKGSKEEALSELVALNYLIIQLLASLPLEITVRTMISRGDLLLLENERADISGFSLSHRSKNKINQISSLLSGDELVFINFEANELSDYGQIENIFPQFHFPCFKLIKIADSIKLQTNRQINYLKKNNSLD